MVTLSILHGYVIDTLWLKRTDSYFKAWNKRSKAYEIREYSKIKPLRFLGLSASGGFGMTK